MNTDDDGIDGVEFLNRRGRTSRPEVTTSFNSSTSTSVKDVSPDDLLYLGFADINPTT